jgi:hypothetical protein
MSFRLEIGGKILYEAQARQDRLHGTMARQILYGGAAGGAKSTSIRWDAISFCMANPGCQAYLFRRTRNELEQNHIVWIKRDLAGLELGTYSETRNAFEFKNGSTIYMCYCERESDVTRYQGAEMHWVGIDEAAHMTEFQLNYLKTRNRLGSWEPERDKDRLPRFVMGSNPGGPGHNYLKQIFIDQAQPEAYFYDETMANPNDPEDQGWLSIFIPAKMSDNRYIDRNYEASFGGLPPELARALREGDWDAVVGQALHTLTRDRHQLRPFVPPRHWTRFMVLDWGTASPFSVGWYAVSEGAVIQSKEGWPERWIPEGAVIRYNEWYGWNGKANQGCRLSPQAVARGIVEREDERSEVMDYRVADSEMWAQKAGPAAMDWFENEDPRLIFRKSVKDRKRNYQEVLARLAGSPRYLEDGTEEEDPMFFCTANCVHFWRTVPSLTLDENDAEKGPGDRSSDENHVYDEVAYACRSRPYVTTELDRYEQVWGDEIRRARGQTTDPYATR